uniref:Uncharacterized protein n=1 Tax=Romanomermis culicivorax TaxID=13658 RepID=A0A915IQ94_ROMCU
MQIVCACRSSTDDLHVNGKMGSNRTTNLEEFCLMNIDLDHVEGVPGWRRRSPIIGQCRGGVTIPTRAQQKWSGSEPKDRMCNAGILEQASLLQIKR